MNDIIFDELNNNLMIKRLIIFQLFIMIVVFLMNIMKSIMIIERLPMEIN